MECRNRSARRTCRRTAQDAMVATAQHDATQVGVDILRAGGNAVDAAVAVGDALAVTDPSAATSGRRLHADSLARRARAFHRLSRAAPLRATATMYLDARGNIKPSASLAAARRRRAGTVAGLETARREFETTSRDRLIAPAVALARDGFVLAAGDELLPDGRLGDGNAFSSAAASAHARAHRQRRPRRVLSGTDRAHDRGREPANGGILTMDDFASYRVEEVLPLHCSFDGYEIIGAPPQAPAA